MAESSEEKVVERKGIAVFLCSCRDEIGRHVDLQAIADEIGKDPRVVSVSIHDALCSREGQKFLQDQFKKVSFERAAVGACSPNILGVIVSRSLEDMGMNKYLFEQVNIRELCAWVHHDKKAATNKAKSLVKGAVAKVEKLVPLEEIENPIRDSALVIGGGVTGMPAALDIAGAGYKVYLIEKSAELGGRTYKLRSEEHTSELQ